MNALIRELLTDIKAAHLIGDEEALSAVIQRIRTSDDPQIRPSALVPVGKELASLPSGWFLPLLGDDDAAVRALAAAAAAYSRETTAESLLFAAGDPSEEVREVLAIALSKGREDSGAHAGRWLESESRHVRHTALLTLSHLGELPGDALEILSSFDQEEDHDLRSALSAALNALAENGSAEVVLSLLAEWAQRKKPNVWVITRALSASWAQAESKAAVGILNELARSVGNVRAVQRALDRHPSEQPPRK